MNAMQIYEELMQHSAEWIHSFIHGTGKRV